jgi:hypothetical protein
LHLEKTPKTLHNWQNFLLPKIEKLFGMFKNIRKVIFTKQKFKEFENFYKFRLGFHQTILMKNTLQGNSIVILLDI